MLHSLYAQQAAPAKKPAHKKKLLHKAAPAPETFSAFGNTIKYDVYNTDSIVMDSGGPYVTSTAEYVWDTISSGYIFIVKEQRLFCNGIKPEALQGDLQNIISVMPRNGFKLLKPSGGEFYVNISEALYDGGEDSIFIAVDIDGFIGGDADFEEHGVVGMRYNDLVRYNDSLYKRPDIYPMNRFGRPLKLR